MVKVLALLVSCFVLVSCATTPATDDESTMMWRANCNHGKVTELQVITDGAGMWTIPIEKMQEACVKKDTSGST